MRLNKKRQAASLTCNFPAVSTVSFKIPTAFFKANLSHTKLQTMVLAQQSHVPGDLADPRTGDGQVPGHPTAYHIPLPQLLLYSSPSPCPLPGQDSHNPNKPRCLSHPQRPLTLSFLMALTHASPGPGRYKLFYNFASRFHNQQAAPLGVHLSLSHHFTMMKYNVKYKILRARPSSWKLLYGKTSIMRY